jgi:hypothetical protein
MAVFPKGYWNGTWCSDVHHRSGEMSFKLALSQDKFSGSGSDTHFGAFTWTGTRTGKQVLLQKHYPNRSVSYKGRFLGSTLTGVWANDSESGTFWVVTEGGTSWHGHWVSGARKAEPVKMNFDLQRIEDKLHGRGVDSRDGAFTWLGSVDEQGNVLLTKAYPYRVVEYIGELDDAMETIQGTFTTDQSDKGSFKFTKDPAIHWVGYWSLGKHCGTMSATMEFVVSITNGEVSGEGVDRQFGKFTWSGKCQPDGSVKLMKHYPQRLDNYIGRLYEDLFVGNWTTIDDAGTFNLQRSDHGQWAGSCLSGNRGSLPTKMNLEMEMVGTALSGKGFDEHYGDFRIQGSLDSSGGMTLQKVFPARTIEYVGKLEFNRMHGTFSGEWKGGIERGTFDVLRQDLVGYSGEWTSNVTKATHPLKLTVHLRNGEWEGEADDEYGHYKYEGMMDSSGNAVLVKSYPEKVATYMGKLAGNVITGSACSHYQYAGYWMEKQGEKWVGYWIMRNKGDQTQPTKMEFTIKIGKDGSISGSGTDEKFGSYKWAGHVDESGNVLMTKTYPPWTVQYTGVNDMGTISGTWKSYWDNGTFSMSPDNRSHFKGVWNAGVCTHGVGIKYQVYAQPNSTKAVGSGCDDRYGSFILDGHIFGDRMEMEKHFPRRTVDYKGKYTEQLLTGEWCNDRESGTFWLERNEARIWKGFWVSLCLKGEKTEMTFMMDIAKDGTVTGKGTDHRYGHFLLSGTIDPLGNAIITKEYRPQTIKYTGDRKGPDTAEGTWESETDSGTYYSVIDT